MAPHYAFLPQHLPIKWLAHQHTFVIHDAITFKFTTKRENLVDQCLKCRVRPGTKSKRGSSSFQGEKTYMTFEGVVGSWHVGHSLFTDSTKGRIQDPQTGTRVSKARERHYVCGSYMYAYSSPVCARHGNSHCTACTQSGDSSLPFSQSPQSLLAARNGKNPPHQIHQSCWKNRSPNPIHCHCCCPSRCLLIPRKKSGRGIYPQKDYLS